MIELYHYWDSFCSFKVRLCLEEKGLAWTGHHLDLMRFENLTQDYLRLNPNGVVPTLIDRGRVCLESSIINEYLDDAHPAVSLRPRDPYDLAQMRLWVRHEEDHLFVAVRPASLNLMMKHALGRYSEAELDEKLRHHPRPDRIGQLKALFRAPYDAKAVAASRGMLHAAFARMARRLASGPWLAGSTYSLADVAAAPVIDRVEHLGMAEVWADFPAVSDWVARLKARPAYQRAAPPADRRMPGPTTPRDDPVPSPGARPA